MTKYAVVRKGDSVTGRNPVSRLEFFLTVMLATLAILMLTGVAIQYLAWSFF